MVCARLSGQAPQLVKGPGVVGQQPVLEPGQSFEYSSACPITCAPKEGYQVRGCLFACVLLCTLELWTVTIVPWLWTVFCELLWWTKMDVECVDSRVEYSRSRQNSPLTRILGFNEWAVN